MSHRPLVPDDFDPPETYDAGNFKLCILSPELLALDYDAYMSSIDYLRGCFGPGTTWPVGVTCRSSGGRIATASSVESPGQSNARWKKAYTASLFLRV